MKNIIIVVAFLIPTVSVFGQIAKGSSTVGGNISLLRETNQYIYESTYYPNGYKTENKSNVLSITPSYGYFIIDNLCVGANVSALFGHSTSAASGVYSEFESRSRSIGAGPLVRYYLPLDDKLYAYAQTGYTWNWSNVKFDTAFDPSAKTTTTLKSRYTLWDAGLGLAYFVNPSTAIEAGFNYTSARYKDGEGNVNNKTSAIAFNIGFRIFLRKA
jgi:outer membrane protein